MPDIGDYRNWTPAAQQRALDLINEQRNSRWKPFYCANPLCTGDPHDTWSWQHARADQRPPADVDYFCFAMIGGRGSGKTFAGANYTHKVVQVYPRITIIAPTSADIRDVVVDGESGVLATARPGFRPEFEPSKRRLTWPNGATALLISAEEPERLRGPQAYWAWCDEACVYGSIDDVWSNLLLGLRLGKRPRVMVTTTPKPVRWLKDLVTDESTFVSTASTYANLMNLAPTFAKEIMRRYEGTRLGRQELNAEIIDEIEGALWTAEMVEACRVHEAPDDMERIVVAIDPAGTSGRSSDETGMIVVGLKDGVVYILADHSGRYSPNRWAGIAGSLYEQYSADAIVAEVNYGGDMVANTMRSAGIAARIVSVRATRGKHIRAEPVVSLFEQQRCRIVGSLPELEEQLVSWVPFESRVSPDRLDAMVWGVTYISKSHARAAVANPVHLRRVV